GRNRNRRDRSGVAAGQVGRDRFPSPRTVVTLIKTLRAVVQPRGIRGVHDHGRIKLRAIRGRYPVAQKWRLVREDVKKVAGDARQPIELVWLNAKIVPV